MLSMLSEHYYLKTVTHDYFDCIMREWVSTGIIAKMIAGFS